MASAQDIPPMGPATPIAAPTEEVGDVNVPIGKIRQPTVADPGWVAGLTLGELYTDNLTLATSGQPKQTSWITQVQPFVKAAYSGPRFSGLLDYRLTGYGYAGQSSHNQLSQNLAAQGTVIVLPEHFFVNGTALYGSEVIDNQLPNTGRTYFLTNNRANVARATLSPYWIQDLGAFGTAALRYSYGRVMYNTQGISGQNSGTLRGISDITSNALQLTIVSPKYRTWGWDFTYSEQRIDRNIGRSIEYALAKLGAYLQLNNNTRFLAHAGKESNFLRNGTIDKFGASFWDVGFVWSTGRYRLRALVGHRFYGRSYNFSWSRKAALLTASIRYFEQPTDINQQLLGQNPGQIISAPVDVSGLSSLRNRQVYLMKRGTASAGYAMPRGRLGVTLSDERRTDLLSDKLQEKVAGANVHWLYDIGPFTRLTPTFGWQRYQFRDSQIRYNRYLEVALVHQLDSKSSVKLRLRHDTSSFDSILPTPDTSGYRGTSGYKVNVVFVQWTHLF